MEKKVTVDKNLQIDQYSERSLSILINPEKDEIQLTGEDFNKKFQIKYLDEQFIEAVGCTVDNCGGEYFADRYYKTILFYDRLNNVGSTLFMSTDMRIVSEISQFRSFDCF